MQRLLNFLGAPSMVKYSVVFQSQIIVRVEAKKKRKAIEAAQKEYQKNRAMYDQNSVRNIKVSRDRG